MRPARHSLSMAVEMMSVCVNAVGRCLAVCAKCGPS